MKGHNGVITAHSTNVQVFYAFVKFSLMLYQEECFRWTHISKPKILWQKKKCLQSLDEKKALSTQASRAGQACVKQAGKMESGQRGLWLKVNQLLIF